MITNNVFKQVQVDNGYCCRLVIIEINVDWAYVVILVYGKECNVCIMDLPLFFFMSHFYSSFTVQWYLFKASFTCIDYAGIVLGMKSIKHNAGIMEHNCNIM